jgi:hypothetical protein
MSASSTFVIPTGAQRSGGTMPLQLLLPLKLETRNWKQLFVIQSAFFLARS